MSSRPRCGTGNFMEGQSFTMHLTQYCRGPTLLGHASTSVLQSKRSYEQMMNDTISTSFQQQMRNVNSFSFDVSVPLTNILHGMPSLLHLSSTENERTNANVDYAEFNNALSVPDCADVPINNDSDDPTVPIIKYCLFQKNTICLPPDIAFQIHLLSKMNDHRGNDMNMFNKAVQCVKVHALHFRVDFTTLQILSRKQLVQVLSKCYQLDFLKPTLHSVPLSDGSVTTVPIFDVKTKLIAFLNDPLQMHNENFASNYNVFTGKKKQTSSTLDEIHTCSLWETARHKYCGDDPDAFPLALICFYDKTNTDVFGSLSCPPFICTPSFLNQDCRNDDSNSMVFGYIPNLGFGKGRAKK
jgi:hypothetical protein